MRRRALLLTVAGLAIWLTTARPASAQIKPPQTVGDQPAATLLLPYFEVDLANPAGQNTLLSVNNASAAATLTHVTVWSAMHVPVYGFDLYLTGYDIQTLNVRDILNGVLPRTASVGQDPGNLISPHGPFSQDINYASCAGVLPPAAVPQATIDHIKRSLTGQSSPLAGGMCATKGDGSQIARGYITVDSTNNCTLQSPGDPGYFVAGGLGTAANFNILYGDYVYTNHIPGAAEQFGGALVHILASATDPKTSTPGEYTFYGRLVNFTAADNREPLSTTFMARYSLAAANSTSSVVVWRDSKVKQNYFSCAGKPAWFPLNQTQVLFFNEQETGLSLSGNFVPFYPVVDIGVTPFPSGAQRVNIGGAALPATFVSGFVYLNLNTLVTGVFFPSYNPTVAQAYVTVHQKGSGRFGTGWPAVMLDSARDANTQFIPIF